MKKLQKSVIITLPFAVYSLFCFAFLSPLLAPVSAQRLTSDPIAISGNGRPIGGANVSVCAPATITSATANGSLLVLTMGSNPLTLGFSAGGNLLVAGFTGGDTVFNQGTLTSNQITGGYTVLAVSSTTITVATSVTRVGATMGTALQEGNSTLACAGQSQLFTDASLSVTETQPIQTDGLGNYGAGIAQGIYYVQIYGTRVTTSIRQISVQGSGAFTGSTLSGQVVYGCIAPNQVCSSGAFSIDTSTFNISQNALSPATALANFDSPGYCYNGNYWTGAVSAIDSWCWSDVLGAGSNPTSILTLTPTGSSGQHTIRLAGGSNLQIMGNLIMTNPGLTTVWQLGAPPSGGSNAWVGPSANPTQNNMFVAVTAGNPIQVFFRNAPWSSNEVDRTNQSAAITTTVLIDPSLLVGANQYRVSWDAKVTTRDAVSSTLGPLTIVYTDPDGIVQTITCGALSKAGAVETSDAGDVTTTVLLGVPILMNSNGLTGTITYAFAYTSNTPGQMIYNLHIRTEAVQ